jgi:hypothetical protein
MCKKLFLALIAGAFIVSLVSAANLFAQMPALQDTTLTEKDINLFISVMNAPPADQAKIYADNQADPMAFASSMAKISTIVSIRAMGQGDAVEQQALAATQFKYSDAELALIKSNEAALIAAFKKAANLP